MAAPTLKWKRVTNTTGPAPRPRHGHRAVAIRDLMIVFGGGNEGIVDELHVYNTTTNQWFVPPVKGDVPPGCAAYGFVCEGTRLLVFGGMVEYGKYSSELYELQASKWEWKRLKPKPPKNGNPPCPRLGHSFTLINNKVYLFGGLANDSDDPKNNIPRYLNDLYTLELRHHTNSMHWDVPQYCGQPPPPRESHTAVAYHGKNSRHPRLIIYGGMSGCRLGDLWQLEIDTMTWCRPYVKGTPPLPRSLHSATLIGHRMFVFGGWVPLVMDDNKAATHEKEWKCTNTLASLNLESMTWESITMENFEDSVPRARAGHCSVAINSRLYIWSGRDGYRKAWNNQVCCKDLWYLETEKPAAPSRVQLVRASTLSLEVTWGAVSVGDYYLLQLQKYDIPPASSLPAVPAGTTPALQTPVAPPPPPPPPSSASASPIATSVAAVPTPPVSQTQTPVISSPAPSPVTPVSTEAQSQAVLRLAVSSTNTLASTVSRTGTVTVVQSRAAQGTQPQQIRVVTQTPTGAQIVRTLPATAVSPTATTTTATTMSGMAALAAAAAATQKITTTTASTAVSSIRVVTPSVITPQGVKLSTVPGGGQTVRVGSPAVIKTPAATVGSQPGKQIIVQKAGSGSSQPQIVTLVKTSQGVTVATVPKMSLIQSKPGALQGQQTKTSIPQGATIVKLVTTQANTSGAAKPQATAVLTTQANTSQPTILGLPSVSPQPQKVITTILRTLPTNIITVAKPTSLGAANTTTISAGATTPKQTFVIAAPKSTQAGTPAKIITSVPKLASAGSPVIVSSSAAGMKTVLSGTAVEGKTGTTTVNVLPLSAGTPLNTITTPSGVKMIVVSSPGLTTANTQSIAIVTTASETGSQLAQTVTPSVAGNATTAKIMGSGTTQATVQVSPQLLPRGILQTKTVGGQKVLTLVPTSSAAGASISIVPTEALSRLTASSDSTPTKVMVVSGSGQVVSLAPEAVQHPADAGGEISSLDGSSVTPTFTQPTALADVTDTSQVSGESETSLATDVPSVKTAVTQPVLFLSSLGGENVDSNSHSTEDHSMATTLESADPSLFVTKPQKSVCEDGVHCGEDFLQNADEAVKTKTVCSDGIHCGTDDEDEGDSENVSNRTSNQQPAVCADGVHCGEEKDKPSEPCEDGMHCGEDKNPQLCEDGIHCGEEGEAAKKTESSGMPSTEAGRASESEEKVPVSVADSSAGHNDVPPSTESSAHHHHHHPTHIVQPQSSLTLEQPGAQPPAQMCADDPPVQPEEMESEDTKTLAGRHSLSALATAAITSATSIASAAVLNSADKKDISLLQSQQPEAMQHFEGSAENNHTDAFCGKQEPSEKQEAEQTSSVEQIKKENEWYDVGVFKEQKGTVSFFYVQQPTEKRDVDGVMLPDYSKCDTQELLPGTAYKFRVCAINACGRGPWSEVSAFKTCLPGYPGAPSAIKIAKCNGGATLSWEAPQASSGEITEYSVYLAMRSATTGDAKTTVTSNPSQLAFVRVYCGPNPCCTVSQTNLQSAHIDTTTKPAIIFRIAARNEKGYGPATQVRWLQDGTNPSTPKPGHGGKRASLSSERFLPICRQMVRHVKFAIHSERAVPDPDFSQYQASSVTLAPTHTDPEATLSRTGSSKKFKTEDS